MGDGQTSPPKLVSIKTNLKRNWDVEVNSVTITAQFVDRSIFYLLVNNIFFTVLFGNYY